MFQRRRCFTNDLDGVLELLTLGKVFCILEFSVKFRTELVSFFDRNIEVFFGLDGLSGVEVVLNLPSYLDGLVEFPVWILLQFFEDIVNGLLCVVSWPIRSSRLSCMAANLVATRFSMLMSLGLFNQRRTNDVATVSASFGAVTPERVTFDLVDATLGAFGAYFEWFCH